MEDVDARLLIDLLLDHRSADYSLGQHFLHDEKTLLEAISLCVNAGEPLDNESHVIEIGPGPGSLTLHLLQTGTVVTAIEIDDEAVNHLNRNFKTEISEKKLHIFHGDALKTEWPTSTHIIANIPYQISSPLIDKISRLPVDQRPRCVVLLVQQEFAERLSLQGGPDSMGSLGLTTALDWDVTLGSVVPPHCFVPSPKVHSRLVRLTPKIDDSIDINRKLHRIVIQHIFKFRRRKVRSRLKEVPKRIQRVQGWYRSKWKAAIDSLDENPPFDLDARPDEISPEEWIELIRRLQLFDPEL
jgi:16S rRNA (adenine1518-N6/adenine1519-N6)-dimethyltransferase